MMLRTIKTTKTQHYSLPSNYMAPTFPTGSIVFVKHNFYENKINQVQRGDVILFARNDEKSGKPTEFLTRVIGLPGDKIEIFGTTVKVNGNSLPHQLVRRAPPLTIYSESNGTATYQVQYGDPAGPGASFAGVVPAGQFFCLGDNRDNSYDSRYTGSVPFASIMGKQVAAFKKRTKSTNATQTP